VNSFTTNTIFSQDTLCSRESIAEAIKAMDKALHEGPLHQNKTDGKEPRQRISNAKTLQSHAFNAEPIPDW